MTTNKNIEFKTIDYVIVGTTALLLLFSWIYAGMEYANLPETIPSHFNHKGEVDGYSGKSIIWIVSGIFTVLTLGVFFLAKSPSVHNVQLKTKEANFRSVAIFMPFIAAIQAVAVYSMIKEAQETFEYSGWILPLILILTALCLVLMFVIISKNKKS